MRYVRFMGLDEFRKLCYGMKLENHTDWKARAKKTESKGFCFFDDSVPPEERIEYLTGVVDLTVCVVFELRAPIQMKESYGRYRDPKKDRIPANLADIFAIRPEAMQMIKEYSVESYDAEMMHIERVGICEPWIGVIEWQHDFPIPAYMRNIDEVMI